MRGSRFIVVAFVSSIALGAPATAAEGHREPFPPDGTVRWFDGAVPSPALVDAIGALAAAAEHGLDPEDYDAAGLAMGVAAARTGEERAAASRAVDEAMGRFLADLRGGRLDAGDREVLMERPPGGPDVEALVRAAAGGEDPRAIAASLAPRAPAYSRLAAALARWRARAAAPEPPPVPAVQLSRRAGAFDLEAWEGAPALRERLSWLGDLEPPGAAGAVPLDEALRRFQRRHGIEPDGVPGPRTAAALGAPASLRVRQIAMAMERLRWLPPPGPRLVHVEIPRAMLRATDLENPGQDLGMRLVVGEAPDHATPMLASRITGIVFRPYWVPTPAILREEILPRERAKPGWLAAHGMEIVASGEDGALALEPDEQNLQAAEHGRLTVRQRPGPRNDLGPVKFVVPNPACIGLHGTPHRRIFERPRRDRSHGCVRLEDPVALAVWVLRGQDGWDRARVEAAIRRDRPTGVRLREPVSLAVTYATASVDPDGSEHFSEDIYGLDADLEARLAARRAR